MYVLCGAEGATTHLRTRKTKEFVVARNNEKNPNLFVQCSACCVDSSNGAVYRLKNLWNISEANATKWFLHLRNQVEVTRA